MKVKTLTALILCATSMQVMADNKPYWSGSDGEYARGSDGHCVRTITWQQKDAIAGCEGGAMEAVAKLAPAKAMETMAVAKEPVGAPAAKETAKAAVPQYTQLSLASGATFALGGSTLSAEGKATVVEMMNQFEGEDVKSVLIEGYTDNTGDADFNQHLSKKRAEAVKAELVANGANPDKITTIGHGEANPIADNNTREGRAKNRRVEIKVDGKQRKL